MSIIDENIVVRVVEEDDLNCNKKEVINILHDNYKINFPNKKDLIELAYANYDDMKKFMKDGSAFIIGAFLNEKVVGLLWAYKRIFLGQKRFHVSQIIVNSEYRGKGIGGRMIGWIEEVALKEEIDIVEVITTIENSDTINFYRNHGFNVTRMQFEKNLGDKNDY